MDDNDAPFYGKALLLLRTENIADHPQGPERALMLAVLEDAVYCALNPKPMRGGIRNKQSKLSAQQWLAADVPEWPFSFVNICAALDFDPQHIRRQVQRMAAAGQRLRQRPRNQGYLPGTQRRVA